MVMTVTDGLDYLRKELFSDKALRAFNSWINGKPTHRNTLEDEGKP